MQPRVVFRARVQDVEQVLLAFSAYRPTYSCRPVCCVGPWCLGGGEVSFVHTRPACTPPPRLLLRMF